MCNQISAEVFPTKYRCTCNGISAAAGKLGSIIAQVFLAYAKFGNPGVGVNDPHSTWLGWVLLVYVLNPCSYCRQMLTECSFTIWMVFGAIITKIWVPNPCNIWHQSRSLEDLGQGKAARKRMEQDEREAWQAFMPDSHQ
jgi:PHS family inorganic phosphate transporter-like MFS transporter